MISCCGCEISRYLLFVQLMKNSVVCSQLRKSKNFECRMRLMLSPMSTPYSTIHILNLCGWRPLHSLIVPLHLLNRGLQVNCGHKSVDLIAIHISYCMSLNDIVSSCADQVSLRNSSQKGLSSIHYALTAIITVHKSQMIFSNDCTLTVYFYRIRQLYDIHPIIFALLLYIIHTKTI